MVIHHMPFTVGGDQEFANRPVRSTTLFEPKFWLSPGGIRTFRAASRSKGDSGYQDGWRRDKRTVARYEARVSALAKRFQ